MRLPNFNISDSIRRSEELILETEEFLSYYENQLRERANQSGLNFDPLAGVPSWIWEYKMKLAELYLKRAELETVPE